MRLHKLSWKISGGILAGFLVVGIVAHALRPRPRFSFLQGHRPVRADDGTCAYELSGDAVELSRRIDRELTGQGFKRTSEERWSQGEKAAYRSKDEMTEVFLVSEADQARPVSVWILSPRAPSRMSMIISEVWSLLSFTSGHRCGSSKNICIVNLKELEGAEATWAIENPQRTNEIPRDVDLFGPQSYIRVKPQCPEGGRYTFGHGGEHPHCSIPWHGLE